MAKETHHLTDGISSGAHLNPRRVTLMTGHEASRSDSARPGPHSQQVAEQGCGLHGLYPFSSASACLEKSIPLLWLSSCKDGQCKLLSARKTCLKIPSRISGPWLGPVKSGSLQSNRLPVVLVPPLRPCWVLSGRAFPATRATRSSGISLSMASFA